MRSLKRLSIAGVILILGAAGLAAAPLDDDLVGAVTVSDSTHEATAPRASGIEPEIEVCSVPQVEGVAEHALMATPLATSWPALAGLVFAKSEAPQACETFKPIRAGFPTKQECQMHAQSLVDGCRAACTAGETGCKAFPAAHCIPCESVDCIGKFTMYFFCNCTR